MFSRNLLIFALWKSGSTQKSLASYFCISSGRVSAICIQQQRIENYRKAAQWKDTEFYIEYFLKIAMCCDSISQQ
jgi:hypothetical protein